MADELLLSSLVLRAASTLVERIHAGMVRRGYTDIRPIHGFVFARLAPSGSTVSSIADHLGVTKQAASQLVDDLVKRGYVERREHPMDTRARLLVLTDKGWACTQAADAAARDAVLSWTDKIGPDRTTALVADLRKVARSGHLRPAVW